MKRLFVLTCALLCVHAYALAQTGFRWAKSGGSGGYSEAGMDVETDAAGNVYLAAHYQHGAVFLDSTLSADGGSDLMVVKLSPSGERIWWDRRGSTADDRANALHLGAGGSLFMAGYGKVSFPRHVRDALTARYHPDGSLAWGRYMDGDQYSEGRDIVSDASLNSYMTGVIKVNGWYGSDTLWGHGLDDAYIVKFDSLGDVVWTRTIGGTGDDEAWAMTIDTAGNVYIAGFFSLTADFGDSVFLTALGSVDAFVAKYAPDGSTVWAKQFGGVQADEIQAVKASEDGSIYFAGDFTGSMNTTAGSISSQDFYDIFYGKLEPDGDLVWIESAGGPNMQLPQDIDVDSEENIYLGGLFFGSLSFDTTTVNSLAYDNLFLAKLDSNGQLALLEDAFFNDSRGVVGLAVDDAQNVTICGYYGQELQLGVDTFHSVGNTTDLYVAKYASVDFEFGIDSVTGSPYCGSDLFEVHFNMQGMPEPGNVFYLELSDNAGSFGQPDTVGSLAALLADRIQGQVPLGLPAGTGYRLRIVSSAPSMFSADNGQDIVLDPATSVPVQIAGDSVICNGVPVLLLIDTSFSQQLWSTGDTTNYLIVHQPGLYTVEATDPNGCSNRDEHFVTMCVGIEDPLSGPRLRVWPNPASEQLHISIDLATPAKLSLTDLTGRILWRGEAAAGRDASLDANIFPRGMYVLNALIHGSRFQQTVIFQ